MMTMIEIILMILPGLMYLSKDFSSRSIIGALSSRFIGPGCTRVYLLVSILKPKLDAVDWILFIYMTFMNQESTKSCCKLFDVYLYIIYA